jgi:hypothetical protein
MIKEKNLYFNFVCSTGESKQTVCVIIYFNPEDIMR